MPAGGRREGAGRKPGLRWHGQHAVAEQSRAQVEALSRDHGADPRGFLCAVMNDTAVDLQTRMSAAATLLPFVYPKLSAQAVVSTRVEASEPGALIHAINARLALISTAAGATVNDAPCAGIVEDRAPVYTAPDAS